ncbi:MAG: glucose-6-phosphate isomerase [Candidatus Gastranaerophilales bacterium]|nr:glucose-6-phosphate isomerase [Candidatus Gastranaerophilales bacterium]
MITQAKLHQCGGEKMIELNYRNVKKEIIGNENGLNIEEEFNNYKDTIHGIIADLNSKKDKPGQKLQWMNLGYNEETLWYVKEFAAMVENRFDDILILGLGGSALGGKAVCEALLPPYWNFLSKEQRNNYPRIFFLDNIDPDQMNSLLKILDLKKTLVNVITKSGSTAEVMAQYMVLKDLMEKELGDDYRKNVIATTDKNIGILKQLSDQEGYKTFYIPDDVEGRFSVFSAVGLLPFALVGINIEEVTQGIKDMDLALKNTDINYNIAAQNALIHFLMDVKCGKKISVMMPYSNRLRYVADWYCQLWAESLGKERDKNNNIVNTGQTPVRATGVTDQHSQIQLYNEGPNDKIINFLRVKEFDTNLEIPNIFEYTGISYLGGKTMNQLYNAEADSTMASLIDYKRPNVTITIPKVSPYYLGQLLYMFEVQTAITGALYNIDAFNQPGVEQSKNYTYALMGRTGYEDSANELKEKLEAGINL